MLHISGDPEFFTNEEGVNLEDNNITSFDYENDTESQGVLKKDKIKFDLMLNYITSMKKIPANPEVENALYERTSFLQENKITGRETSCHKCHGDLALEKISSRSKIVTMRKVIKGNDNKLTNNIFRLSINCIDKT